MSSLWYEYLEETGGQVIPLSYFKHVSRSLEHVSDNAQILNYQNNQYKFAFNHENDFWWPILISDKLSEGWIKFDFCGLDSESNLWYDIKNEKKQLRSIRWCLERNKIFKAPNANCEINIDRILEENRNEEDFPVENGFKTMCIYQSIKIGAYLECWLENCVGFVWPVKVLSNVGGRLKLIWFGCDSTPKQASAAINNAFSMFYLDYRLHSLGWARLNSWKYSSPLNIGINISISNVDTFVRGSPSAFPTEHSCNRDVKEHFFEEGWQIEAVNPTNPHKVHSASIRYVLDRTYFLVELDRDRPDAEPVMFPAFGGMAEMLPANTSAVSGYPVSGLDGRSWESQLDGPPARYAPHLSYFQNGGSLDREHESGFVPGCKLEAVNPWNRHQIHAATVVRVMDGSRLVWVQLDSEPDLPEFLVDPETSTELFPVDWCSMVGHPLTMPAAYTPGPCGGPWGVGVPAAAPARPLIDHDDVTIFLHLQCYLGPFLSRSAANDILPRFIGPGHCLPVLRELFRLLLKVSHKPYKLMRLLQLTDSELRHDLMAVVSVPSPKSEWGNRNKRYNWSVEVAARKRAIPAFCRQTALSLGACPHLIGCEPSSSAGAGCSLGCSARMAARAGDKMSGQRRKRLFCRPLTVLGISYRDLKARVAGTNTALATGPGNSSNSNSGDEDNTNRDRDSAGSDRDQHPLVVATGNGDHHNNHQGLFEASRMCTRNMRVVVTATADPRRRRLTVSKRPSRRPTANGAGALTTVTVVKHHGGAGGVAKRLYENGGDEPDNDDEDDDAAAMATVATEEDVDQEIEDEHGGWDRPPPVPDKEHQPPHRRRVRRRPQKCVTRSVIDVRDYVIDPTFLAGDIERVSLSSNPVLWSVEQLTEYLAGTDCRQLTSWLAQEKVDGRAFLLLTLPVLSTLCGLQLEVAIRLARHVVSLKRVFVEQYADLQQLLPPDEIGLDHPVQDRDQDDDVTTR